VCLGLASALVALCTLGKVTRKVAMPGVLAHPAGTVGFRARESGQVLELRVREGSRAREGDVLVVIGTERLGVSDSGEIVASGGSEAASLRSRANQLESEKQAKARYFELRIRAAQDRAASLGGQLRNTQAEAESLAQRDELAKAAAARYTQLAANGFMSAAQLQAQQDTALDASARLQASRRAVLSLAADRDAALSETQVLREQMAAELAAIARAIESNRQDVLQNAMRQRIAITAPAQGTVSTLQLAVGQSIQQGDALFDFLPDAGGHRETPQVQLFASSRTVGFVKPGQAVNLRVDAFPFQKFGMFKGVVTAVSRTPYSPADVPQSVLAAVASPAAAREPMYRIVAEFEEHAMNQGLQLRPGMSVTADVLLETRAIWEWVFEPLIAIHHKL
jgi:membrane fusion protein